MSGCGGSALTLLLSFQVGVFFADTGIKWALISQTQNIGVAGAQRVQQGYIVCSSIRDSRAGRRVDKFRRLGCRGIAGWRGCQNEGEGWDAAEGREAGEPREEGKGEQGGG